MCHFATTTLFLGGFFVFKSLCYITLGTARNWHCTCNVYQMYFHMEASSVAAPRCRTPDVGNVVMEQIRQREVNEQEPIGIIISRGSRTEEPPRFSAYVWGPVPGMESSPEEEKPAAA